MRIKKAKKEDISKIVGLTQKAWAGYTKAELLEKRYGLIAGKRWYEHKGQDIKNDCQNNLDRVLVAEERGNIVGYAIYHVNEDSKIGTVGYNAVNPEFRGRGIGSVLHEKVLEELKKSGVEITVVSTLEIAKPAQRLYERHGFKELVRVVHYSQRLK